MIKAAARVLRGGSWINNARNTRSANRNNNQPDNRNFQFGFRLALAHALIMTLFDPIIILSVEYFFNGKNQLPFDTLVVIANAYQSGDLTEYVYVP